MYYTTFLAELGLGFAIVIKCDKRFFIVLIVPILFFSGHKSFLLLCLIYCNSSCLFVSTFLV